MRSLLPIALAFLPSIAAAQDIPALALSPGEAVTVRFDDGGRASSPERGRAEWTPLAIFAARHFVGMTPPEAPVPTATPLPDGPAAEPPIPGQIRVRFFSIADRHAMLVVENGLQRPFIYRARITLQGRTRPTDVCVVTPGSPAWEHWPDPIERIDLTDFRYVDWKPGDPVYCE